ncbi:hypothetical protein [Corynebacterium sp. A21]|uniref:hypothetical protein n=1 Tax=Corynebacterium sp. A21 TaxID=3457318 RepID=UPI003FD26B9D
MAESQESEELPGEVLQHPVIAVVDKRGADELVVWHVQTTPDAPSASGVLSGAWILGGDEVDPGRLADLLRDTVVLAVSESVAPELPHTTLAEISAAMIVAGEEVKKAAKDAKAANKALQLPRLEAVNLPDPAELQENYRGEEIAARAWAHATATAELVEQWHALEAQRRSRKYLQESFGAQVRPLPLRG